MTTATTPTVLISGTSSGIGLATAVQAAQRGFHVVAGVRDLARITALEAAAVDAGVSLDIARLDVTDPTSIKQCLDGVIERHGRLDALVNNAGSAHVNTVENDTMIAIRSVLEVNFFGVVALTRAAMPHLRAAGGRVITVSSVGGVVGQPFNEAYCAAKFAVEGFMESLAPVAATVGVKVSLVEPGAVASSFVSNAGIDQPSALITAGPYEGALRAYFTRTAEAFANAQPAADAAAVVVQQLVAQSPALRVQTSDAARSLVAVKLADVDGSRVQALTRGWVQG